MPRRRPTLANVWGLCRTVRAVDPALVQGWMYHGNLAATVGGWSLPQRPPVIWNVRHSVHDLTLEKPLTRLIIRLSARMSRLPRAIIYNSRVSAAQHQALGFEAAARVVIPNGFDTARFRPQADARARLCQELGIDPAPDDHRHDRPQPSDEGPRQSGARRRACCRSAAATSIWC